MSQTIAIKKILTALGSRLARNIYFWLICLWFAHEMNLGNERGDPYRVTTSSWYWWVIMIGVALQTVLVYVNNLVLVPRLLVPKKRLAYGLSVLLLVTVVSLAYTFGLKLADKHIDVDGLQQVGMVTGPITAEWSSAAIIDETETYLIGNLLWVFVFTMAWYMNDYARQRHIAEQALRKQAETELIFLKNQLNPHFLFNTLNNIYALTLRAASEAPDTILKLSSILRYLLYESNVPQVSFEKEKEVMLAYIDLELLRLKDRDNLHFSITADRNYQIPPLLWLPLLENVFKHGTRIISRDISADYRFSIAAGKLTILATNYCRPDGAEGEVKTGIGLLNLRKRLALLYPHGSSLRTSHAGNTFTAEVIITLA